MSDTKAPTRSPADIEAGNTGVTKEARRWWLLTFLVGLVCILIFLVAAVAVLALSPVATNTVPHVDVELDVELRMDGHDIHAPNLTRTIVSMIHNATEKHRDLNLALHFVKSQHRALNAEDEGGAVDSGAKLHLTSMSALAVDVLANAISEIPIPETGSGEARSEDRRLEDSGSDTPSPVGWNQFMSQQQLYLTSEPVQILTVEQSDKLLYFACKDDDCIEIPTEAMIELAASYLVHTMTPQQVMASAQSAQSARPGRRRMVSAMQMAGWAYSIANFGWSHYNQIVAAGRGAAHGAKVGAVVGAGMRAGHLARSWASAALEDSLGMSYWPGEAAAAAATAPAAEVVGAASAEVALGESMVSAVSAASTASAAASEASAAGIGAAEVIAGVDAAGAAIAGGAAQGAVAGAAAGAASGWASATAAAGACTLSLAAAGVCVLAVGAVGAVVGGIGYAVSKLCIPADALVTAVLAVGGAPQVMPIEQVPHGAMVLTSRGFSHMYLNTHMETVGLSSYQRLETSSGHAVELSARHYIRADGRYMMAQNVKPGMSVAVRNRRGSIDMVTVATVSTALKRGAFDPATLTGDLVVHAPSKRAPAVSPSAATFEGIVISDMSAFLAEDYLPESVIPPLYHALLSPVRGLFYLNPEWVERFHKQSYELVAASRDRSNKVVGRSLNSLGAFTLAQIAVHSFLPKAKGACPA